MLDERKADEVETTVADKKRAAYEIVADAMAEAEAEMNTRSSPRRRCLPC